MSAANWGRLILLSILFGGSFFLAEIALTGFGPLSVVAGRVAGAAVVLLIVCRAAGLRLPTDGTSWRAFAVMGLLNNAAPFVLIIGGQTQITGAMASILISTTPMFTVLLAHFLTRDERFSWQKGVGVAVGFAGVVVLIGPETGASSWAGLAGQSAILAAACCYALAGIFGKRFRDQAPLVSSTGMLIASTAMILPLALAVEAPWTAVWRLDAALAVGGLALLSTAWAYLLYFRILAGAGATNLMLVTMLVPLSGSGLGVAFLDEPITWAMLGGGILILCGLAAIDGRVFRRRRT